VCLLAERDIYELKERLERAKTLASNPLLALVMLLSIDVDALLSIVSDVYGECEAVEIATGYDLMQSENTLDQMADFTGIPQRLKLLSSRITTITYFCSCLSRTVDGLENILQSLHDVHCNEVSTALQERLAYFRECSTSTNLVADRGNKLVQSMVQTVRIPLT